MDGTSQRNTGRRLGIAALALALVGVVVGGVYALRSLMRTPAPAEAALTGMGAGPIDAQSVLDSARAYMDSDQAGAAEAILRRAVERLPTHQQVHFLLGEALLAQARPDEAYAFYDQGILIGPDHPEYRHAAATIAATIGRFEDAELHYRAAQRLDPANPKYPLYLAQVQRKQGHADEARASLVVATKIDPDLAIAWGSLAAIAMDEGRLEMAEHYLGKAVALEPERTEWRVMRARILRRQNQPQDGATVLLALPESVRTTDKGVIQELATCYGMLSRADDAAGLYQAAVATFPDDPEMAYQAALWLDRAGKPERARTYAQMAAAQGHEGARKFVQGR